MDALMCRMQGNSEKAQAERFRPLPVRVAVVRPHELKSQQSLETARNPASDGRDDKWQR